MMRLQLMSHERTSILAVPVRSPLSPHVQTRAPRSDIGFDHSLPIACSEVENSRFQHIVPEATELALNLEASTGAVA